VRLRAAAACAWTPQGPKVCSRMLLPLAQPPLTQNRTSGADPFDSDRRVASGEALFNDTIELQLALV
jgi:hypothetical protein